MIAYIKGAAVDMTDNSVVIDHQGIGFEVFMTGRCLSGITIGKEYKIYTYFHVKEDGMQLFGFFTKDDIRMFRLLMGVNGIGPRGALGILGALTADELRFAVLSDDLKTVSKAPGVGKKTAQKLILELKDKLDLGEAFETKLNHVNVKDDGENAAPADEANRVRNEAVEALTALGYSPTEAMRAVKGVTGDDPLSVEDLLRAALRNM